MQIKKISKKLKYLSQQKECVKKRFCGHLQKPRNPLSDICGKFKNKFAFFGAVSYTYFFARRLQTDNQPPTCLTDPQKELFFTPF